MVEQRKKRVMRYPALRDAMKQYRADGGTRNSIRDALGCNISMVARYEEGTDMPRPKRLAKLAELIGVAAPVLRGEAMPANSSVPGVSVMPMIDVTQDEQVLLEAYRNLPPHGQESMRVHATRLLRQFGAPSKTYPFGRKNQ